MPRTAITIKHLAARLNLSKGTVSRILNDENAPFASETRQRVQAMAAELGYQPNPIARALVTGRTGSVSLWIRNLLYSYDSWVARSFEAQVEAHAYRPIIRLFGRDLVSGSSSQVPALSDQVDGIVTHGLPPKGWMQLRESGSRRVPLVVTGHLEDPQALDYVGSDLFPASVAAVKHLLEPGRKRVAHLSPIGTEDARFQAYRFVMEEAGLSPEYIMDAGEGRAATRRFFRDYVLAHGCPEGLFCENDDTAIAAYRALLDLGLRVPDDVALVGCDGIEDAEYLPAPITTIVQPIEEMCRQAWQFLEKRLHEPDTPPQQIVLTSTLVLRESSRP